MGTAGAVINGLFDVLLYPFGWLPSIWGLLFVSLLSGLGMIAVFKAVSDQRRIAVLRRRMGGEILGILLHVSSPGTVLRFAGRLIWSNTVYLAYLFKPLIVIAVPFMLLWGQLEARYGSDGLAPGTAVTVSVQYTEGLPPRDSIAPEASGIRIVPPVMLIDTLDQASFRLEPERDSRGGVLEMNGMTAEVGRTSSLSGSRIFRGFDSSPSPLVLFTPHIYIADRVRGAPAEGWYTLPGKDYDIFGWHWSWIAVFLVFSMLSAVAGARIMKVRI